MLERILTPTPPLMVPTSPLNQNFDSINDFDEVDRNEWNGVTAFGWEDIINPSFGPKDDTYHIMQQSMHISVSGKSAVIPSPILCRDWENKSLVQWDSRDVIDWLASVSLKRLIDCEQLNMANFRTLTGLDLINMGEGDFWNLNPHYGNILFVELQALYQSQSHQAQQPALQMSYDHNQQHHQQQHLQQQQQPPQPPPQQPVLATLQPASQQFITAPSPPHINGYMGQQQFANSCAQAGLLPSFGQLSQSLDEFAGMNPGMYTPPYHKGPAMRVSSPGCSSSSSEGSSESDPTDDLPWMSPVVGDIEENHMETCGIPKKTGRPKKLGSKKNGKKCGRLWEFIRDLLKDPKHCPSLVRWEDHDMGTFRFMNSEKVAQLWGDIKGNPRMTYEKLSRAMRYYYKSKVLLPVLGRRLVYKFGPNATNWRSDNPNFALSL